MTFFGSWRLIIQRNQEYVRAVRAVRFRYACSEELNSLLDDFRLMCNDAIKIALQEKPKNRFALIRLAYPRLKEYGLHTHYILSACEVAFSIYRNKERRSRPYVRRAFLKLGSPAYILNHMVLRIPTKPRRFIYLVLQGSRYHLSFVDHPGLKRGSITLTPQGLSIAFSKEAALIETGGKIGIDLNERNVTTSDTSGRIVRYDTSEIAELKERYRDIRAKIGERTRQDRRISQHLYHKYGKREKDRTVQRLHLITKSIVQGVKEKRLGIVMENLNGIRKLYRKGNGQGATFRGRMNSWTFREVQRQIEYKARWEGLPVSYVSPRYTSRNCSKRGSSQRYEGRMVICPSCGKSEDRDENASKNIMMAAQVRAARPPRGSGEGESRRQETASNPPSGWVEVDSDGDEPKS